MKIETTWNSDNVKLLRDIPNGTLVWSEGAGIGFVWHSGFIRLIKPDGSFKVWHEIAPDKYMVILPRGTTITLTQE